MADENEILGKIKKAVEKDYNYIAYNLPHYDKDKVYERGYLKIDGETIETPAYSFTEISDVVKKAFEELYKVKSVEPIGFRGERFFSDEKELEIHADAGISTITYRVKPRYEEEE